VIDRFFASSATSSTSESSTPSSTNDNDQAQPTVPVTYVEADGTEKTVDAPIGKNLLEIAHDNNVELEGACGGELACSTCHLIFEPEIYATLPPKKPDEDDMLDLAFEVTETSRLGCQIKVTEDMAGMKVRSRVPWHFIPYSLSSYE
jgi:ferredoxin